MVKKRPKYLKCDCGYYNPINNTEFLVAYNEHPKIALRNDFIYFICLGCHSRCRVTERCLKEEAPTSIW